MRVDGVRSNIHAESLTVWMIAHFLCKKSNPKQICFVMARTASTGSPWYSDFRMTLSKFTPNNSKTMHTWRPFGP